MVNSWIRGVRILDPLTQRDQVGDVLVCDRTIQAITLSGDQAPTTIPSDTIQEINGHNCILGPGLVDLYSQTGEPGHESRERLSQLLKAAAQGGFTRVSLLPTTIPAVDNPAQVAQQVARTASAPVQILPWGAISQGAQGKKLTDLTELSQAGVAGLADGRPLENGRLVQRLLEYTQTLKLPLALWPSTSHHTGVCREGPDAIRLGLSPLPRTAETGPLTALLEEIAVSLRPVHIMRVSTARSVELIRDAKTRGLPVTASVTWLHLLFSTADLDSYAPSLRLAPPVGTPVDQAALIAGLEDGTLDAIAVDHRAYTYEEKAVPFGVAPAGAIGLQQALPMLWHTFVETNRWTALQLWRYLSLQPAQCLGLEPTVLQAGSPANLVLFDANATWTATADILGCDPINTPYGDQTIQGLVKQIWH